MGKLYILGTPIGNLKDITLRGLETLKEADFVLAEDTRVVLKLLNHYEIKKPVISFFAHSPMSKIGEIAGLLREGQNLVFLTDAGTPNISDPGHFLISGLLGELGPDLEIVPVPGPSALTALISAAHFPLDEFVFLGFPPHKKGRQKFFGAIAAENRSVILFESPHRLLKTLEVLAKSYPLREMILAKELTKFHERIWRGTVEDVYNEVRALKAEGLKGEFVMALSKSD